MVVNIEFMSDEPLENVITCLNYKIDKVIFFGADATITKHKGPTEEMLKRVCHVKEVAFEPISRDKLDSILSCMDTVIQRELASGSQIYIDATGGDEIALIACGILNERMNNSIPIHIYNIPKNKITNILRLSAPGEVRKMTEEVERQEIRMNIAQYLKLRGACIHPNKSGIGKTDFTPEYRDTARKMWSVYLKHKDRWDNLCKIEYGFLQLTDCLTLEMDYGDFERGLKNCNKAKGIHSPVTMEEMQSFFHDMADEGLMSGMISKSMGVHIQFATTLTRDLCQKGGDLFEIKTACDYLDQSDDYIASVKLDWDGEVHDNVVDDVHNEIDGLMIKDNILTVISCKAGSTDAAQPRVAMYELDTVATRFGGKYVRRILATVKAIEGIHIERAEEMGITLVDEKA